MKKYFLILSCFLFFFTSCLSYSPLLVMLAENGSQQYFIRPEKLKKNGIECTLDFTLYLADNKITGDVIVNYTLGSKKHSFAEMEKWTLSLVSGNGEFATAAQNILYRNPSTNQIRVSSLLSAAQMTEFITKTETFSVLITTEDTKQYVFLSNKLREKLLLLQKSLL